jgi:hypothetical protein
MYGLNRERRMFDRILYEVDSSGIPRREKRNAFKICIRKSDRKRSRVVLSVQRLGYRMDYRGIRIPFLVEAEDFSHPISKTSSGAVQYNGYEGCFPGVKAAGA